LFNYVDIQDSQQQPYGPDNPNATDAGNIGNYSSFEFPTLLHDELSSTMTCRGLIGISNNTVVKAGNTLTFKANSKVHMLNGGNLTIEPDANLVIESGVEFIKDYPASANKIEVNGSMSNCNYVTFNGGTGMAMEVITNNVNNSFMFDHCTFINSAYKGTSGLVTMDNGTFAKSYCSIGNAFPQQNLVYIRYNTFQANGITTYPAIIITGMKKWVVIGNTIDQFPFGVKIWNSGKSSSPYIFSTNAITNCTGTGATFYNSRATISYNTITGNYKGIESLNNSTLYVYGLCNATSVGQTQQISFNTNSQFESTGNFPVTFKHNAIQANNTTSVRVKGINCPANTTYNIEKNYWGNGVTSQQMANILSIIPSTSQFDWDPAWPLGNDCSGGGGIIPDPVRRAADSTYQVGIAYNEAEDYSMAKSVFTYIIYQYPSTQYAQSALYELFFLESKLGSDFNELKDYYENDPVIAGDTAMANIALFMANQCNIELKNYSDAIAWFESIIDNTATFNDTVFAIIDLGYTYLMAEADSMKSCPIGQYEEYKPKSQPEFVAYRDYLLSLIGNDKSVVPQIGRVKQALIHSLNPNPAHESITVNFSVAYNADVVFAVRNTLGQIVIQQPAEHFTKGTHFETINCSTLASGTYILTISINGIISDSNKLIIN